MDLTVNGIVGATLYAGGFAGTLDEYQVNFTLPPGIVSGIAQSSVIGCVDFR